MVAPLNDKIAKLQSAKRAVHLQRPRWGELLERMSRARIVCVGEASHGTEEFYAIRAELTRELIEHHEFTAVAVEADWPDAYRVNRYVQNFGNPADGKDTSPEEALGGFKRFPSWMWRNTVVREFVRWMRGFNDARQGNVVKAGFYGIDLYSLYGSIAAVVKYLDQVDPAAARRARERYSCFEYFHPEAQQYGYAAGSGMVDPCEPAVVKQLMELQRKAGEYARRDGRIPPDEFFFAEQNARLIRNAELYYRSMYRGRDESWNLRDTHMADTIDALLQYLLDRDGRARLVIWAHNSHLGDARATSMSRRGELNVGQLMRERHPSETFHLGFTTFDGSVLAASNWDEAPEVKAVRPGMERSVERLFHEAGGNFWLPLQIGDEGRSVMTEIGELLERAIGVIYRPETERLSHYFYASLAEQFDAVIHVDRTHAPTPLDPLENVRGAEVPETYPSAV